MKNQKTFENNSFLPNFCNIKILFIVILSSELLAITLSLMQANYSFDFLFNLAMKSLFIQWISITCVGVLCLFRKFINQQAIWLATLVSYILILVVSFAITEIAWWRLYIYPYPDIYIPKAHNLFIIRSMSITIIIASVVLRYLYIQHQWKNNIEIIASSKFQALQARIRPHFLFNCMNTIASLIRKSPELAEQTVEDLSDLFRASLLNKDDLDTIETEWELCENYLRIESHRLGSRLTVDWDIKALPKDAIIPQLVLQPLLENSIYHGIEKIQDGGKITITGTFDKNILSISFSNPIPTNWESSHKGNKYAQKNINQRLHSIFGEKSNLSITKTNNKYTATINIPYKRHENINSRR